MEKITGSFSEHFIIGTGIVFFALIWIIISIFSLELSGLKIYSIIVEALYNSEFNLLDFIPEKLIVVISGFIGIILLWIVVFIGLFAELIGGFIYWEMDIMKKIMIQNNNWLNQSVKDKFPDYHADYQLVISDETTWFRRMLTSGSKSSTKKRISHQRIESILLSYLFTRDKIDLSLLNQRIASWRIFRSIMVGNIIAIIPAFIFSLTMNFNLSVGNWWLGFGYFIMVLVCMTLSIFVPATIANRSYKRVCEIIISFIYITT